jgi:hypothetical protein
MYRFSEKETVVSSDAAMSGFTLESSTLNWSPWSEWSRNAPGASADREIETRTIPATVITQYQYSRWIKGDTRDQVWPTNQTVWAHVGVFELTGWLNQPLTYNGIGSITGLPNWIQAGDRPGLVWYYEDTRQHEVSPAVTEFRHRNRVFVNTFSRWGNWSSWQEAPVNSTENRNVETTTFYRWRER